MSTAALVGAPIRVPNDLWMGTTHRRGKVTAEHQEEARRLKARYEAVEHGLTQEAFGEKYEIGNQSAVWQFLNGRVALSLDAAMGFATGLGCEIKDFSPRLATQVAAIAGMTPRPAEPQAALSFLNLKSEEVRLIGLFRELKPRQRLELERIANEMHVATHPAKSSTANPYAQAPAPPATVSEPRAKGWIDSSQKESDEKGNDVPGIQGQNNAGPARRGQGTRQKR